MSSPAASTTPAIETNNLHFSYGTGKPILKGVDLLVQPGQRVILTGENGSGKTTLERILGGKHMASADTVRVLGRDAAFDNSLNTRRSYVSAKWGMRSVAFSASSVPLEADIAVRELMKDWQVKYAERYNKLVQVLAVNLDWRMHQVSDGQRRRVQLLLSLTQPFEVLLLDEVTVDLDVVTREDLLEYLKEETETRGVAVVYATHIFDGLDDWTTHIAHLDEGRITMHAKEELEEYQSLRASGVASPLYRLISKWIRATRNRQDREKAALADAAVSRERRPANGSAMKAAVIAAETTPAAEASATSTEPAEKAKSDLHRAAGGFAPSRMASYY